jgi:hypothetical protein
VTGSAPWSVLGNDWRCGRGSAAEVVGVGADGGEVAPAVEDLLGTIDDHGQMRRNRGRFEAVDGSLSLDLASGASAFAQNANWRPLSVPLVTRMLTLVANSSRSSESGETPSQDTLPCPASGFSAANGNSPPVSMLG